MYRRTRRCSFGGPQASGTAVASGTAGAASGSGGGGGIGEQKATAIIAEINPGTPATMGLDGKRIGISDIVLEVLAQAKDVSLSVTKLVAKPASVTQAAGGTVYSYFDFSVNVANTNIRQATVRLQVPEKWLAGGSIDKSTVRLQRWADSKWDDLGATLLSEDKDYAYYESTTTGFSTFAVTGEKIGAAAAQRPVTPEETAAQQQMAATAKPAAAAQATAVLVAVLIAVIAIVAYTMLPKRRRGWR